MQSRIVARLTAPVAVVSGLLVVVAIGAAWYARDSQRRVSEMLDSHVASVLAAQELEISLRELQLQYDRYLSRRSDESAHLAPVPELRRRANEALAVAKTKAVTEQEQHLMGRVDVELKHFFEQYDRLEKSPPPQATYAAVRKLIDNDLARVLKPAGEYLKINEAMLNKASEANKELSQRLTVGMIGLGVCGSIGGLLGGWVIAVSLRRSLLDTDRVLRDTAAQLGEAAHAPPALPMADASNTTLQQVTAAAAAVLARLKQTERDALRAEQLAWVGQMAAGIAHEVRNPLTVIKLLVQAATDTRRAVGFRPRDLRVLEGEILRLEHIISGFLDFARPPRPAKKTVATRELLDECVEGVAVRAELQRVEIRLDAPAQLPALNADPGQIKQVVYNLLFNAIDALTTGGAIRVSVSSTGATGGPELTIRVADSGPGLPAELEGRIFDPFVSTKETGLGLGLSICKRIVEAHGGSIAALNDPGGGAVFVVRLPCPPPAAAHVGGVLVSQEVA